jgi:3-hydroxyacyl-CoA dehydrogenase
MNFYRSIGKSPIRLKREIFGHIANRLQTAIWREALHLISTGVASAEDIDTAITDGPGLRWAVNGPCTVLHVSGGRGGVRSTVEHMGKPTDAIAQALYQGSITPEMFDAVIASVEKMMQGKDIDDLTRHRDLSLLAVIQAKKAVQAKF